MLLGSLSAPARQVSPSDAERQEARAGIEAAYVQIAKARIAFDKSFFDSILAPNFVTRDELDGAPIYKDRNQFMQMLTANAIAKTVTYSRFDFKVEAINKSSGIWFAITCEKTALHKSGFTSMPDRYGTIITKDGWQNIQGKWILVSQDIVGSEFWLGKPPANGW